MQYMTDNTNLISLKESKGAAPCQDSDLKRLCSEYANLSQHCENITGVNNQPRFRERRKILEGSNELVDLYELKDELLKTKGFKFKAAGWCMFPVLKKGDILKVEPVRIEDIKIGDIPVYRSQANLLAHRIVDKRIIEGKQFIITRADSSTTENRDSENANKVPPENLLGRIVEVRRGGKAFSTEKRKTTSWDKLLYKKTMACLSLTTLFKETLETTLTKIQSFKVYAALGRKFTAGLKPYLDFELAIPFSNAILNRIYTYKRLDDTEIDISMLTKAKVFHLVMKFNNASLGCVTFLNKPHPCPYKGFWISDIYIRLRYRRLGFESILLEKAEGVLRRIEIYNRIQG